MIFGLLYYDTVDKKAYDEVENDQPPTHARKFCYTRYCIVQNLSNNRMLKWFVGLVDLEQHTARDKQAIWALENYQLPMYLIT